MNHENREFTVHLTGVDPDQYADIVNAVWMQMQAIGCDFTVTPDDDAVSAELDARWDGYSQVSWKKGGRGGTPQAEAAKARQGGNRRSANKSK